MSLERVMDADRHDDEFTSLICLNLESLSGEEINALSSILLMFFEILFCIIQEGFVNPLNIQCITSFNYTSAAEIRFAYISHILSVSVVIFSFSDFHLMVSYSRISIPRSFECSHFYCFCS